MNKNILWVLTTCLMVLSLIMAACAPAATPTVPSAPATPAALPSPAAPTTPTAPAAPAVPAEKEVVKSGPETPKYGGTLALVRNSDPANWDPILYASSSNGAQMFTSESMWTGDWARGNAGGYGTKETDWGMGYDLFSIDTGTTAASWQWLINTAQNQGTLVYQIRPDNHYGLNPNSEASRLAGGRAVTADDVVFSLSKFVTDSRSRIYGSNPELRTANITKTGPLEVTVKLPLDALISAISRFGAYARVVPPEVWQKYGDLNSWKNSVGTGPFILTDYIPGSLITLVKNPRYWGKDPVGPGKSNQIPYIEGIKLLVIPDASTRQAALRTGKIDKMTGVTWEDAGVIRKTSSQLLEFENPVTGGNAIRLRIDLPPFNDLRVRQAIMMATDLEGIRKSVNGGLGQIHTWPFIYNKIYAGMYLSLDDPEMPASVRELYTYNPEKAKQLLKDAGYPTGFKTSALIASTDVDFYSILKDMWSKAGIDLTLDVKESTVRTAIITNAIQPALTGSGSAAATYFITPGSGSPVPTYYLGPDFSGISTTNAGMINDPLVNETMKKVRLAVLTDEKQAMKLMKDMWPYFLGQAYAIPKPSAPLYTFWWPWLKNYSGEDRLGYGSGNPDTWTAYVWYDAALKKSMGY